MLRPSIARPMSEPLVFKKGLLPEGLPEVGNKIKIEGTVFVDAVTHRRRRSGDNFNVFRHFKKIDKSTDLKTSKAFLKCLRIALLDNKSIGNVKSKLEKRRKTGKSIIGRKFPAT